MLHGIKILKNSQQAITTTLQQANLKHQLEKLMTVKFQTFRQFYPFKV